MADYNFNLLTPADFEELARDLIQEEYKIRLESFTPGKDSGIDFRYIGSNGSKIIVQCKHYSKSGYAKLKSDLEKKELEKVRKLKPDRYILVTSLGLTPSNKDEIKAIFEPYINGTEDIFGFDDLNNLLRKYGDIAKKNHKLWFTSVDVLDRIVHSAVYNQSDLEIENIKECVKIFVKNQAYFQVQKRLKQDNFCIIIGNPGIGKTTIAQYILSRYLENDYNVFSIKTIDDVLDVFDPTKKQFFYYDDFLGQSIFGDKLTKNEDQQIINLLDSIKKSKNTKFLLTTRSYILNQAQIAYEKLNNAEIERGQYTVELSNYDTFERAKILYNHLWYSTLPDDCITDIVQEQKYSNIITHRNFTPRIVKIMTAIQLDSTKSYAQNFFDNLENPEKVWEHAFEQQISDPAKHLLLVLNTLPKGVEINKLRDAFNSYQQDQSKRYGYIIKKNDFKNSLKELDGSFIIISSMKSIKSYSIEFENPSIHDFVNHYLMKNPELLKDLVDSVLFFQQNILLWNLLESFKTQYKLNIKDYSKEFTRSVIRTFDSDLRIYDQWFHYRSEWIPNLLDYSFEKRMYLLFRLCEELETQQLYDFISQLLIKLVSIIEDDKVNISELFALLEYIEEMQEKKYHFSIPREDLFAVTKELLLKKLESLESFEQLRDFLRISKYTLSEHEFDEAKLKFEEEFQSTRTESIDQILKLKTIHIQSSSQMEDLFNSEKITEIESAIKLLEEFSDFFTIDLIDEIEDLQKKVDEYYKDYEPDEDDAYESYKDAQMEERDRQESQRVQNEIDELFLDLVR